MLTFECPSFCESQCVSSILRIGWRSYIKNMFYNAFPSFLPFIGVSIIAIALLTWLTVTEVLLHLNQGISNECSYFTWIALLPNSVSYA